MHADLIRELTLLRLPVTFNDSPTIAKIRDLKNASLVVAAVSDPADPRPYASVLAITPSTRAAEEAKGFTRVHFVGGQKDGEYEDMVETPPVLGFSSPYLGSGRTLYNLKRDWHIGRLRALYLLDGAPDALLNEAMRKLNQAGLRTSK